MSHYHVSGGKTEEFPAHVTFLSVVQPEAVGHKRARQPNNTGRILFTWEGGLVEKKARADVGGNRAERLLAAYTC